MTSSVLIFLVVLIFLGLQIKKKKCAFLHNFVVFLQIFACFCSFFAHIFGGNFLNSKLGEGGVSRHLWAMSITFGHKRLTLTPLVQGVRKKAGYISDFGEFANNKITDINTN